MTDVQRVAIVTGSARGIGAATARRLARDGLAVAVLDLDAEAGSGTVETIRSDGGTAAAFSVDVTDADRVKAAVSAVAEELGPPVVLVNNAGVLRDNLIHKMSEGDWDTVISVHLRGAFLMTRETQTFMVQARWGRIINISSTSAQGNRGQANYAAAKAGLQGFTKTLCKELGPFGITVNCVAPGLVVSAMTKATAARLGVSFEDFEKEAVARIPVGRIGRPEDIANAVAFLAHEDTGFVSGEVIYVAGGPHD
jgi:3-oxoacyl-[acyl-carrier protein] reductase